MKGSGVRPISVSWQKRLYRNRTLKLRTKTTLSEVFVNFIIPRFWWFKIWLCYKLRSFFVLLVMNYIVSQLLGLVHLHVGPHLPQAHPYQLKPRPRVCVLGYKTSKGAFRMLKQHLQHCMMLAYLRCFWPVLNYQLRCTPMSTFVPGLGGLSHELLANPTGRQQKLGSSLCFAIDGHGFSRQFMVSPCIAFPTPGTDQLTSGSSHFLAVSHFKTWADKSLEAAAEA